MATTYNSSSMNTLSAMHWGQGLVGMAGTVIIPISTTLAQNDIINLCRIPPHSMIVACSIVFPDLDSQSGVRITLEDDVGTPNVFVSAVNAESAGIIGIDDFTGNYQYVNEQILRFLVGTGAGGATAAAGKIQFAVAFALNYFSSPT